MGSPLGEVDHRENCIVAAGAVRVPEALLAALRANAFAVTPCNAQVVVADRDVEAVVADRDAQSMISWLLHHDEPGTCRAVAGLSPRGLFQPAVIA